MNWVTTNIRFPEDMYMELKMEAAVSRKSVAEIVREKVSRKIRVKRKTKQSIERFMKNLDRFAKENAKYFKGKSASKALIEMRYEQ